MANPVLESFRESPKACVTNSSRPLEKLKGKENPDLPTVCSNYWPPIVALSLCFNNLVLSTFRQCRSAIPHNTVPLENDACNLLHKMRTIIQRWPNITKPQSTSDFQKKKYIQPKISLILQYTTYINHKLHNISR